MNLAVAQPPLPLLVTGIAGVAGYNAFRYFHARYPGQVVGVRRADNYLLGGDGIAGIDLQNQDALKRLFDQYQFAAVLSCEGSCALRACELDPPMAWRVNVLSLASLLEQLQPATRFVHLSIDLVFSGTAKGDHREADAPDPVTIYGKTMAQTEQLVLHERPDACVLRISLPMGVSFNGHAGAIDWIQSRFRKNKPATLYYDEVRTPTYVDCMNRVFAAVLASDLSGLYHAGGPRKLSLYQIAQIVNRIGGYHPKHLLGCYRVEAGPVPPRAGDVTMDSHKLAEVLGFEPFDAWPLYAEHAPTHRDWHWERPVGEKGSADLLADMLYRHPTRQLLV